MLYKRKGCIRWIQKNNFIKPALWQTILTWASFVVFIVATAIIIDATRKASVLGTIAFIVSLIALSIWIAFFAQILKPTINVKKCIKRLEASGEIDNAVYELNDSANEFINKNQVQFTKNFIFAKGKGIAVKYDDILWCYKRVVS